MSLQIEQKETSAPSVFIPVRKYIPATHNSTENLAPNPKNKKWNRRAGIILDEIFSKCKSGDQKFTSSLNTYVFAIAIRMSWILKKYQLQ